MVTLKGRLAWLSFPCIALLAGAPPAPGAPATPGVAQAPGDPAIDRVRFALAEDPYFYDGHVVVSARHGNVVLRGIVFSDWDLMDALRIANRAAAGARVVNELTLLDEGSH